MMTWQSGNSASQEWTDHKSHRKEDWNDDIRSCKKVELSQGKQLNLAENGLPISSATTYKYLGVHFVITLNFETYFNKTYKKAAGRVTLSRKICSSITCAAAESIYTQATNWQYRTQWPRLHIFRSGTQDWHSYSISWQLFEKKSLSEFLMVCTPFKNYFTRVSQCQVNTRNRLNCRKWTWSLAVEVLRF